MRKFAQLIVLLMTTAVGTGYDPIYDDILKSWEFGKLV